jgi:hypothetical protein
MRRREFIGIAGGAVAFATNRPLIFAECAPVILRLIDWPARGVAAATFRVPDKHFGVPAQSVLA